MCLDVYYVYDISASADVELGGANVLMASCADVSMFRYLDVDVLTC